MDWFEAMVASSENGDSLVNDNASSPVSQGLLLSRVFDGERYFFRCKTSKTQRDRSHTGPIFLPVVFFWNVTRMKEWSHIPSAIFLVRNHGHAKHKRIRRTFCRPILLVFVWENWARTNVLSV